MKRTCLTSRIDLQNIIIFITVKELSNKLQQDTYVTKERKTGAINTEHFSRQPTYLVEC